MPAENIDVVTRASAEREEKEARLLQALADGGNVLEVTGMGAVPAKKRCTFAQGRHSRAQPCKLSYLSIARTMTFRLGGVLGALRCGRATEHVAFGQVSPSNTDVGHFRHPAGLRRQDIR